MRAALRRIPEPLVLALVAIVVSAVYQAGHFVFFDVYQLHEQTDDATSTLLAGSWFAFGVLSVVGYEWLQHRISDSARIGVRIALSAAILGFAARLYFTGKMIVEFVTQTDPWTRVADWQLQSVIFCAISIALAIGLGFAVRRGAWIILAIALAVIAHPPWFIGQAMFEHLGWRWTSVVSSLLTIPWAICQLAMLAMIMREPAIETPRPTNGFVHARRALVVLALSVGVLTVVMMIVDTAEAMPSLVEYRWIVLAATAAQLAALVAFALAALSIPRSNMGMPVWLLVASATAALCVAGRTVFRIGNMAGHYFQHYFDRPDYYGRPTSMIGSLPEPAYVSTVSAQLLVACSIALFLAAIAVAAKRRALDELRARTMVLVGLFAALSLASLSGQKLITTSAELSPLGALILLGVGATFVASAFVAVLAIRRGADALAGSASLPVARLR